ncbi:MAG: molybdopterin-dependent oxidoreductase [Acidobacteria bacterium]|nr:molybdopterin-dependent oxidoreductase [Acidobacteriota bacterium]
MATDRISPPRSWGRSTVTTACPLDCPDSCSLSVTVERGEIVKIDGNRHAPSTDGYICGKVRRFDRRVYSGERLLHPLVRTGPKGTSSFERLTWDEAIDLLAGRIRQASSEFGPESVLPFYYGGSNGLLTSDYEDARFFRRIGASRLARTVCAAPTGAAALAMYGKMPGVAYPDYAAAQLIVIWGCNASASGIHLVAHIRRAQQAGARLVVIDPRLTPLARTADLHLPVRPGTDLPVALALVNALFEHGQADLAFLDAHADGADALRRAASAWPLARAADEAGVPVADLERLAAWYAAASPAVIRCGWGQERNRNGGSSSLAILALPAIAGKFGVRGGGYTMSNSAAWGVDTEALIGTPAPASRVINMNQLGGVLTEPLDPPIKVLFVYNCNPLSTMPNQNGVRRGLAREDLFTVVHEQVMTDTATFADLLLPAPTFLEQYDVARGYGAYHFHLVQPVIAPIGEARANQDVFRELGLRLGVSTDDALGEAGAMIDLASRLPEGMGTALLEAGQVPAPHDGRPVQFVDVHPRTANGRIQLHPGSLARDADLYAYRPDPATARCPLALISPASEHTISSTLGELRPAIAQVKIHPHDAAPRSIADGDAVRLFNDLGEVQCHASVTPEVRPGTLAMPKGLWARSTFNGSSPTALVPDSLTDFAGGACFNDARVQIELLGRH